MTDNLESGRLEDVDPGELILEDNVRVNVDLDAEFIASIKEHGVIIPIAGRRDSDGRIYVRAGQRRTLAARAAGLSTVPVYVRDTPNEDDKTRLVNRVAEQIVENDQRRELTEVERVRGVQQMLDAGASATKVARKLSIKPAAVKAAGLVSKSDNAMTALETGQLSLTEAAALTEFDDDPKAAERLAWVSGTSRFEHVVAQLRGEKLRAQKIAEEESLWREKGYTILGGSPEFGDLTCIPLCWLQAEDGSDATEAAVTDPAHWAVVIAEAQVYLDVKTGEVVDEDAIDWDTEGDAGAQPEEGMRHADSVKDGVAYLPDYYCLNYVAAKCSPTGHFARTAGLSDDTAGENEDAEAAQLHADEAKTRARKKVLLLNRHGLAAQSVRRDFVSSLLSRKTPPKGAGAFTAHCLAYYPQVIGEYRVAETTQELLGVAGESGLRGLVADQDTISDARAHVVLLGLVLGALEQRTDKTCWREAETERSYLSEYAKSRKTYLVFLAEQGYTLSDIEKVITGELSSDAAYDAALAEANGDTADTETQEPDEQVA